MHFPFTTVLLSEKTKYMGQSHPTTFARIELKQKIIR